MATAKTLYPNFFDNGVRVVQAADGSMEITVIPKDPDRLCQFVFTVPATGTSSTATVLTPDLQLARDNVVAFITAGSLPAGTPGSTPPSDFQSKIDRATIRARRSARQASIDAQAAALAEVQALQTADPAPPAG